MSLSDTNFFAEFLQAITFGDTLSFTLTLAQSPAGTGVPDSFAFFLLKGTPASPTDPLRPVFGTGDPTGALFAVDMDGPSDGIPQDVSPRTSRV